MRAGASPFAHALLGRDFPFPLAGRLKVQTQPRQLKLKGLKALGTSLSAEVLGSMPSSGKKEEEEEEEEGGAISFLKGKVMIHVFFFLFGHIGL